MNAENPPKSAIIPFPSARKGEVSFDRKELDAILRIYGLAVAAGVFKDYAIDQLEDRAVFSIFRRASEMPFFRIEKKPALANKQGAYCVIAASGHILKRGAEIKTVLKILEKELP